MTWQGQTRTIAEWSDILGVSRQYLYSKLNNTESPDEIFTKAFNKHHSERNTLFVEEVYNRLSTMHIDYELLWATPMEKHSSLGMVTNYGKIQTAPTNRVSNVVESLAIPEAMLSDDVAERRAWIGLVLYLIQYYQNHKGRNHNNGDMKAFILEARALKGKTLKAIMEEYNHMTFHHCSLVTYRNMLGLIVNDIIDEAQHRGLLVEPQK